MTACTMCVNRDVSWALICVYWTHLVSSQTHKIVIIFQLLFAMDSTYFTIVLESSLRSVII